MRHFVSRPSPSPGSHASSRAGSHGGFSLVEMLIAITVLALLGMVVLQVFLSAENMNIRAESLDRAVSLSVDATERIKSTHSGVSLHRESLSFLFPEALVDATATGWKVRVLFDEDWNASSPAGSDHPAFMLTLVLMPDPETSGISTLLDVSVEALGDIPIPSRVVSEQEEDPLSGTQEHEPVFAMQAAVPNACIQEGVNP